MLKGPCIGREQYHLILDNIRGLFRRAGFLTPDSGLDVLGLTECSLRDRLTLIQLCQKMSREQAEAETRMADIRQLQEREQTTDQDAEALRVAPARADDLTSQRVSLDVGLEQAQAQRDNLEDRIGKLEVDTATYDGKLGTFVRSVPSLKTRIVAGETRANTAEVWPARHQIRCPSFVR